MIDDIKVGSLCQHNFDWQYDASGGIKCQSYVISIPKLWPKHPINAKIQFNHTILKQETEKKDPKIKSQRIGYRYG